MKNFDRKEAKKIAKIMAAPKPKQFGDARDKPDYSGNRSTMPPRTREGKTHPGGRRMRRALARLESNRKGILACRAAAKNKSDTALKMPGAIHP